MKKLLVILMLGAGLVSVASADEPLVCSTNPTNQCCVDVSDLQDTINHEENQTIVTQDGHYLHLVTTSSLVNDGVPLATWCEDKGVYVDPGNPPNYVVVTWLPGDWVHSIRTYPVPSANKDNAIIH